MQTLSDFIARPKIFIPYLHFDIGEIAVRLMLHNWGTFHFGHVCKTRASAEVALAAWILILECFRPVGCNFNRGGLFLI